MRFYVESRETAEMVLLWSLSIAHITKGEQGDQKSFGSIFWYHKVRALWYAKRAEQGPDPLVCEVGFYPRKFNFGARPHSNALRFAFGPTETEVVPIEAATVESLAVGLSFRERVTTLLQSGARTITGIANALDVDPDSVRKVFSRDKQDGEKKGKPMRFSRVVYVGGDDRFGLAENRRAS